MKKLVLVMLSLFSLANIKSQVMIDPGLIATLNIQGKALSEQRKGDNKLLKVVTEQQMILNTQMERIHTLQDKVYKGLTTVSSVVSDGYEVKDIILNQTAITKHISTLLDYYSKYPTYAWFNKDSMNKIEERCKTLYINLAQVITGGEYNMMNNAQRRALLREIRVQTSLIRGELQVMIWTFERAKRHGFFNTLIGNITFVNTDSEIVKEIMVKFNGL